MARRDRKAARQTASAEYAQLAFDLFGEPEPLDKSEAPGHAATTSNAMPGASGCCMTWLTRFTGTGRRTRAPEPTAPSPAAPLWRPCCMRA